jgi:hypothetical protein
MLVIFFVFLISWLIEPRRLINGVFFTIFLVSLLSWTTVMIHKSTSHGLQRAYDLLNPGRTFWHRRNFNLCLDLFVLERLLCLEI